MEKEKENVIFENDKVKVILKDQPKEPSIKRDYDGRLLINGEVFYGEIKPECKQPCCCFRCY